MDFHKISEFYTAHKGGIIGAGVGVFLAILILIINFWNTLFIAILGLIGYYLGNSIFNGNPLIKAIIDKIFPPGRIR